MASPLRAVPQGLKVSRTGRALSWRNTYNCAMKLQYIEQSTGPDPVGTVVWLHGLGADATDFEPLVPLLRLNQPLDFVFPNAPRRPVTINGGMAMRAWYDIDPSAPLDATQDINASTEALLELVQEKVGNENSRRVVLAGFSQGGVIALSAAVTASTTFKGIMALSTYVHNAEALVEVVRMENLDTPIFMAHGLLDPMIPVHRAVNSRAALGSLGFSVEWHEYSMGHEVCPQEITDIARWLNTLFDS